MRDRFLQVLHPCKNPLIMINSHNKNWVCTTYKSYQVLIVDTMVITLEYFFAKFYL